jgi:HTH-type transcriptional regulator/antitoxin HigA
MVIEKTIHMESTAQIRAAKKFGPGYFIREQLELREWTQEDLTEVMGITLKHINKILQDKQPITLETARILSEVFNTSPHYWLNIDTGYRLWLAEERSGSESKADIKSGIFERMPIRDMVKKGWLKPYQNLDKLQEQVRNFWGWETIDFTLIDEVLLPCLTRKSTKYNQYNASYAITWYQMAMNVSKKYSIGKYQREKLAILYDDLHTFTMNEKGIERFLEALNECGVIFFVLPHLQKTYLDGACFISQDNPAIVFTGRYKRIDHFWFTIAHEIAHVLFHLDEQTPFILDDLKNGERNGMEDQANQMAAEKLRHDEISKFLHPYRNYLPMSRVEECAAIYGVHPSIVLGKLAFDQKISYKNLYRYKDDVLASIPEKYKSQERVEH